MAKVFLTSREVMKQLSISRPVFYRLIDEGEIPALKMGKNYRIDPDDLQHYINQKKNETRQRVR